MDAMGRIHSGTPRQAGHGGHGGHGGHAASPCLAAPCLAAPCLAAVSQPSPLPESGWLYFAICAAVFVFAGLLCGYFIWRKAAMQAEDAVMEVERSAAELRKIQAELEREERVLAERP